MLKIDKLAKRLNPVGEYHRDEIEEEDWEEHFGELRFIHLRSLGWGLVSELIKKEEKHAHASWNSQLKSMKKENK